MNKDLVNGRAIIPDKSNAAYDNDIELEESKVGCFQDVPLDEPRDKLKSSFPKNVETKHQKASEFFSSNQKPESLYLGPIPVESEGASITMQIKGIATLTGSFLIHLTLGHFFTLGNMTPYIMSYLKNRAGFNVTYSLAIWINALQYLGQGSLMVVGGLLERKIGGRYTCFIGGFIFCGSIALSGILIKFGFVVFALVYGLLACWGLGIAYVPPLAVGMKWYPQNKGLSNGIILSGYGLGPLLFNQVQTAFLNPRNIQPAKDGFFYDDEVLDKIPRVFYLLGCLYGALILIGIMLLFPSPFDKENSNVKSDLLKNAKGQVPTGYLYTIETKSVLQSNKNVYSLVPKEMSPRQMLKRKEFYGIWMTFALICQCIQFINTYYKTYGQLFIRDDRFLSIVGSLASICNCLGRIVFGRIQDWSNFKVAAIVISLSLTALMLSFVVVPYGGKVTFVIWVLLSFFFFSGIFPIMPTATDLSFGSKFAGTNFGLVFTAPAISSILGAIVIQIIMSKIGFDGVFFVISGFTFIAFIINVFMPDELELIS